MKNMLSDARFTLIEDWEERIKHQNHGTDGPRFPGTKVVVTKETHDLWIAQLAGLNLDKFPTKNAINEE